MSRDVNSLEKFIDRTEVLSNCNGDVAEAEKWEVHELARMEGKLMVLMISENEVTIVVKFNES